jgi:hypothetical protein
METKHTPGPWIFRLEAVRTVIFHNAEMGEKAIAVGAGFYPSNIANARLIAAAPDLLEAAIAYKAAVDETIAHLKKTERLRGCFSVKNEGPLIAAIAKATGA